MIDCTSGIVATTDTNIPSTADPLSDDTSIDEAAAILIALAQTVEQRDPHTARHCERLATISVALGMRLSLDRPSLIALYRGGFLHDIGKVGIPDAILFKPTRLTAEEWVIMRSHTLRGEQICCHVKALKPVLPIIRHHHERWDGSGYPDGLRGTQIPHLARVLQVADIYDALTSPRPYKHAYSPKQALRILEEETERGWRDPEIVTLFFELHGTVISRIDQWSAAQRLPFSDIRDALANLDQALAATELRPLRGVSRLSGRTSFLPPRPASPSGSPLAARDTSHTV